MKGADVDLKPAHLVGPEQVPQHHVLTGGRERRRIGIITKQELLKGFFETERQPASGERAEIKHHLFALDSN